MDEINWQDDPAKMLAVQKGRQYRLVYLRDDEIIKLLNLAMRDSGDCITIRHPDIPLDVMVVRIFDAGNRGCLGIVVGHPSFDPVPDNMEYPALSGAASVMPLHYRRYTVESIKSE